jgi:hypothetical protein
MKTPEGIRPAETLKEYRKRIHAEIREMRMTRKKFAVRCKEILASTHLTERGKAREIEHAATRFVEDNIVRFPEIRSIEKRRTALEEKHSGYCQVCGSWSPKEPPEIVSLDREWGKARDRKIDELCRKVLSTRTRKAA